MHVSIQLLRSLRKKAMGAEEGNNREPLTQEALQAKPCLFKRKSASLAR